MEIGGWDVASVAIKALTYGATLSAAGGAGFLVCSGSHLSPALERQIRRWLGTCIAVAVLTSVIRIGVLSGSMGGDLESVFDGGLARMVLEMGESRATGLRVIGLLTVAASLVLPRRFAAITLGGAIIAATSFASVGHAWAASRGPGSIALLSLHLVCVAFWLGALTPLWMATHDDDLARLAAVVQWFGLAAVYVVGALLTAGGFLLVVLLSTPSELWTTDYGRLVLVKLAVVACLLGVASFNKFRLTPRLQALDRTAASVLRRTIQVEIALGVTILLVTAAFTTLVGPASLG